MLAAGNGHESTVKLLLEKGANIHAQDNLALVLAAGNGHESTVKLLLEKGAIRSKAEFDKVFAKASERSKKVLIEFKKNDRPPDDIGISRIKTNPVTGCLLTTKNTLSYWFNRLTGAR